MPSYTPPSYSSCYPQKRGTSTPSSMPPAPSSASSSSWSTPPSPPSSSSSDLLAPGSGSTSKAPCSPTSLMSTASSSCGAPPTPSPAAASSTPPTPTPTSTSNSSTPAPAVTTSAASSIGAPAEQIIHLFCILPRLSLLLDDLLFRYSEAELVEHLALSEVSLREAKENGASDSSEPWRRKLQSLLPAGGITAKHAKTGEDVAVSRRAAATLLLMTIADFSEQLFEYQDKMFDNEDGRLELKGNNWAALWPATGKPGLWMNLGSKMGALYNLILREEEIYLLEERKRAGGGSDGDRDEQIELVIPPVFDNFTKVLDAQEQIVARDSYWEAVCGDWEKEGTWDRAEELLLGSCEKNPFVGEPHLVLAQVYLNLERYEEAEREAERGLRLIIEWGSSWDKRMAWEGWVAWGRAMLAKAKEKSWPRGAWGIINLGLVG